MEFISSLSRLCEDSFFKLSGLCFAQSVKDGNAPQIFIHSTHQAILNLVDLETLKSLAIDLD